MAKKNRNIIIKQGLDDWVMTYGDMMSLLLTFFVLIVSFSSMQETKFKQAAASLADAFGVMTSAESVIEFNEPIIPNHSPQEDAEILYEVRSVEKMILEAGLQDKVEVQVTDESVLFRINAPFMFRTGGAELKDESKKILDKLARFFTKFPYQVQVQGHTDSIPINSTKFPSNWDLSAARAVTVARYFQSLGIPPVQLEATGYGEYRPLADNATVKGRNKNRRVEIFLKLDKKDLPKTGQMPFQKLVKSKPKALPTGKENVLVRPIINPVTGKLGSLTGQRQP